MGVDLDLRPELVPDRRLEPVRERVRGPEGHAPVDLDVEADAEPAGDSWTMTWCTKHPAVRGDQQDALEHGLVVELGRLRA